MKNRRMNNRLQLYKIKVIFSNDYPGKDDSKIIRERLETFFND